MRQLKEPVVKVEPGALRRAYYFLEDGYYSLVDRLDSKGLPVGKLLVKPLESRDVPSFPIAVLLVLGIIAVSWLVLPIALAPRFSQLEVTVLYAGEPVEGAAVALSLDGGAAVSAATDSRGVALLRVPADVAGVVSVGAVGFEKYSVSYSPGVPQVFAFLKRERAPMPLGTAKVKVADGVTGQAVSGAVVEYVDEVLGRQSVQTGIGGAVEFGLSGNATAYVFADGFEYSQFLAAPGIEKKIMLQREAPEQGSAGFVVHVVDSFNKPVDAVVELRREGSSQPALAVARTLNGTAVLSLSQTGAGVYAVALPLDPRRFWVGRSASLLAVGKEREVAVPVESRFYKPVGKRLKLEDNSGNPVAGAFVELFEKAGEHVVARGFSSPIGVFEATVPAGMALEASVFAGGFIPVLRKAVPEDDLALLELTKLDPAKEGNVTVAVVDSLGRPVAGAWVDLKRLDGNYAAVGRETDWRGLAYFQDVPSTAELRPFAFQGARSGAGLAVSVVPGSGARAVVVLEPASGRLVIRVVDGGRRLVSGRAVVSAGGREVASCSFSPQAECIAAGVPEGRVDVALLAPGFAVKNVYGVRVTAGQDAVLFEDKLVPEMEKNIPSFSLGLFDGDCASPAPALVRGGTFCLKADWNSPANETDSARGFFVRLGANGTAAEDDVVFSAIPSQRQIGSTAYDVEITRGNSFSYDGFDCDADAAATAGPPFKWVSYEFSKPSGSASYRLLLAVKPNATGGVFASGFSYARKGGKYYRTPEDQVLGASRSLSARDWCQADSVPAYLGLGVANAASGRNSSVALEFSLSKDGPRLPELSVPQGREFYAFFTASSSQPVSSFTVLRLFATGLDGARAAFALPLEYNYSSAGGFEHGGLEGNDDKKILFTPAAVGSGQWSAGGWVKLAAVEPVAVGKVAAELSDWGVLLARANATVSVTGNASIDLVVSPKILVAGFENDVSVLATSNGTPVGDTVVQLAGEGGEAAFVVGTGEAGKGKGGEYLFSLTPLSTGALEARAGGSLDARFEPAGAVAGVEPAPWLELSSVPLLLSVGCLPVVFNVTNLLPERLKARLEFSGGCVQAEGEEGLGKGQGNGGEVGTVAKDVLLRPGANPVFILPLLAGSCSIAVGKGEGQWLPPSVFAPQAVAVNVDCAKLMPSCRVSPEKTSVAAGRPLAVGASLENPPGGNLVARFSCGGKEGSEAAVPLGGKAVAQTECVFETAAFPEQLLVTAEFLGRNGLSTGANCSALVTVLPGN